ncbi:TPR and ankyrin repeat-containing protein 1-like isoform X2 [Crassostrea virginica]
MDFGERPPFWNGPPDRCDLKKIILQMKENGNLAYKNKDYEEALVFYNCAINLARGFENLNRDLAMVLTNRSAVYSMMHSTIEAMADAEEAVKCDQTWMKGHWRRGQILRQMKNFRESYSAFLEGYQKGDGTPSEKCSILVEAVLSFTNLSESQEMQVSHKGLSKVPNKDWGEVLTKLSNRGEWTAIQYLVLGITFGFRDGHVTPTGVARDADFRGITYSSLFQLLETHENPVSLSPWICPLVLVLITQRDDLESLMRFRGTEMDSPLTAATRFCALIGDTLLLSHMPNSPQMMEFVDGLGDTPFHTLFKMSRCPQGNSLATFVKLLLQKGVSPCVRDLNQLLPIDYVDPSKNKETFDILRKFTQSTANAKPKMEPKIHPPRIPQTTNAKSNLTPKALQETKHPTKSNPKIQYLKSAANEMFKKGNIPVALDMYSNLLTFIFNECIEEVDNHEIAVIYGNQVECLLRMGVYDDAYEAAVESVAYDAHWFKSHLRVGKVHAAMGNFEKAVQAFRNSCNELDDTQENFSIRLEILAELSNSAPKYMKLVSEELKLFLDMKGCNQQAWAMTSCNLIGRGQWDSARFAYRQYLDQVHKPFGRYHDVKVNLQPICDLDQIVKEKWVMELIRFFLMMRGDYYRTLSIERGDSYFHTVVRMTLVTNNLGLFDMTLIKVNENKDQNTKDSQGNTVLHVAAKEKRAKAETRFRVIIALLEVEVNPLIKNKAGKYAVQYLPRGDKRLVGLLLKKMAKQEAMEKEMKKFKARQEQEQARMERERNLELHRLQREEKREEMERKQQIKKQKEEEARKKNPHQNMTNMACVEYCEHRIEEAKEKLKENNMRHGYLRLAEVLKKEHKSEKHKKLEKMALDILITSLGRSLNPEIPEKLAKIPHRLYEKIVQGLAANEKWRQVYDTVKEHRLHYGDRSLPNFAKSMSLAKVIRHSSFQGSEQLLVDIVECMLNSGAELEKEGKLAILAAVQECQFKVLEVLFNWGANPVHLSINQGDTPIHAALSIALERDKENFSILNSFFEMYERDPEKYPMLDPSQTNAEGDGLFQLVAKATYSATTKKATELLFDKKVNSSVINKEGKLPKDYLNSENDRWLQFFPLPSVEGVIKPKKKQKAKFPKVDESKAPTEEQEEHEDIMMEERQDEISTKSVEIREIKSKLVSPSQKAVVKRHIEDMIFEMPDIPYSIFNPEVVKVDEIPSFRRKKEEPAEDEKTEEPVITQEVDMQEEVEEAQEAEEAQGEVKDFQIDPQVFDNLEWEVECTADVWKTLMDKKVVPELKQRIILKIQLLAKGEWRTHLYKELKNVPPTIKLYEVKLSKASRIIWELATAFSPRLSEDAEKRLQYSEDEGNQPVRGGKIYSEVIRVWDIVFDHDKIFKSVQRIIKSHCRGKECIIQRKLKGVKQSQFQDSIGKRFPMAFAESDVDFDAKSLQEYQEKRYYPPASSNETEYHILKFYNFDSNLVSCVLHNLQVKVDFPFRVTDLEHAIINLKSKAPILLLGRSGTGKTMCCLYRLWSQYVSYWTGAIEGNVKLLPRCRVSQQEEETADEVGDDEENSEEEASEEEAEPVAEGEEDQEEKEEGQLYDHLHQIFITKNVILCSEVQKNFKELSHACDVARNFVSTDDQPLPNRIQDISDNQFPIFITSKKLLLMLDASLQKPCFFERNKDGSLKVEIQGWSESDGTFSFLPMLEEGSDDEEEEEDQYQDIEDDENEQELKNRPPKKVDPRREVTYEVFAEEVWPRICKKFSGRYHPSLIWMEIMSFIQGSFEALSKPSGYLSKEEYLVLGRKRAPNFSGEREHIYDIFKRYDHFKRQKFLFDETDLVQNVYNRLKKEKEMNWIIHQIYVDETQDFTQAELCLLLRVCHSPNEMFLTGDTAQSIMRGIAFRFNDLRSLFFYAKKSMHAIGKFAGVKVPKMVHQLTHNYRSHDGILSLASSILDLMVEFFPESFDRLQKDQGLFQGPRPVLLESCSFSDLAVLLRGNKRKSSHIEFGAHQAILVVNDAARDSIPEELNLGLILTIYEAKGLEFDDILLYNFFKDSQATKEWRAVTQYLEKLAATHNKSSPHTSESLVEIDADVIQMSNRPRPMTFDPNQHKVLNAELKRLYTAVTRARVNVWIFDEDMEKRAPMFEYFKARKLTRNSSEVENDTAGGMFAEESTTEQWLQRGDEFMKHSLYEVAAKCFNRGQNFHMERIAIAHHSALLASRRKDNPFEMREAFLLAAEKFLECDLPNKAVICLQNAREKELVALLYEKTNQLERAGKSYCKLKRPLKASRCYEQLGKFNMAVETLVEDDLYEMAIDTLKRYKHLKEDLEKDGIPMPQILVENAPSQRHTTESLSFKSAVNYHRLDNKEKMMAALERLPKLEERTDFLISRNYIEEAASLLEKNEKLQEAVDLYTKAGMNRKALRCAQKSGDKNAIGQSLILDSKIRLNGYKEFDIIEKDVRNEICENLDQAFLSLQDLDNKLGAGEAALLRGELTGNIEFINKAFGAFLKSKPYKSEIGQLECMHWMVHNSDLTNRKNLSQCIFGMQNLFKILSVLAHPEDDQERIRLTEIVKFFGFYHEGDENKLVYYPKQQPRALREWPKRRRQDFKCEEDKLRVQMDIFELLVSRGMEWKKKLEETITTLRNGSHQCPFFKLGEPCSFQTVDDVSPSCPFLHASVNPKNFDILTEYDILAVELELHIHQGAEDVMMQNKDGEFDVSKFIPKEQRYRACKWLLEDLIPENYHIASILSDPEKFNCTLRKLRYHKHPYYVRKRIIRYLKSLYDEMKNGERKDNIKVFVTINFINHLLNLDMRPKPDEIMRLFDDVMRKEFLKKQERRMIDWAMKLGLMVDYDDGRAYVQSIAKRFCDGYDQIMGANNNPSEALIQFTKFCVLLSNTGSPDILPHCNHLLLWMEYFTIVAFCLSAKVRNTPNFFFVVPESFISVVYFIDATFVQERGVPTFEAVQRHRIKNLVEDDMNLFHERLRKLIGIACGYDSKINLIQHVFQSIRPEKTINEKGYGIAERLLVLALVFICNLGKSVRPEIETKLMGELCKLQVMDEYPARLSNALKQVQQAGSPADVADALQTLLSKREGDCLQRCIWDNNRKRNGLQKQQLKTTELGKRFLMEEKTLQAMDNPHVFELSKLRIDEDETNDLDTQMTEEEKLEKDRNREEKERRDREERASKKITDFMKKVIFRLKTKNILKLVLIQLKKEKFNEKMKVFGSVQITDARCGVCAVDFREMSTYKAIPAEPVTSLNRQTSYDSEPSGMFQPSSPVLLPQSGFDSEKQTQTTPSPDAFMENPLIVSKTATKERIKEIRKEHEQSQQHKDKIKHFHHFRHKYNKEISDVLDKVRGFIQRHKLDTNVVETHFKEDYNINSFLREMREVENKISYIIRTCDWENADIKNEVDKMNGSYHSIKRFVEDKSREIQKRSDKQREATLAKVAAEEMEDDIDIHIEPVVEEPREKRKAKGRGKRKSQRR